VTPDPETVADDAAAASSSASGKGRGRKGRERKQLPLWQETILLLGIALVLAVVIKAFFVQAFWIPSESMEPGLQINDRILVEKVSYWGGGSPERGDIVVFKDPGGWLTAAEAAGPTNPVAKVMAKIGLYPQGGHLVKRVIGVEGDVIHCCDDQGRLEVNGQPLDETGYARTHNNNGSPRKDCAGPMTRTCEWTAGPVPAGHIFVMGDNRWHSADSTVHMCREDQTDCVPGHEYVATDEVVGKVFVLLWPRQHFAWIHRPSTFVDVPAPT
jgi:signal peptidase I